MPLAFRGQYLQRSTLHLEQDASAVVVAQVVPHAKACKDGLLPVRGGSDANLKRCDQPANRLQQVLVESLDATQVVVGGGVGEHERGNAFLDDDGTSAVFGLIDARVAAAFRAQEL